MFLLLTVSYLSATPLYVTAWHFMAGCILFFWNEYVRLCLFYEL